MVAKQEACPAVTLPLLGGNWIAPHGVWGVQMWGATYTTALWGRSRWNAPASRRKLCCCLTWYSAFHVTGSSLHPPAYFKSDALRQTCKLHKNESTWPKWDSRFTLLFLLQRCLTGKTKEAWTSMSLPVCGSTSQTGRTSSGPMTGTTPASSTKTSSSRHLPDLVSSKVCFWVSLCLLWWGGCVHLCYFLGLQVSLF